jgi:fructoselysine-6-P-deglycase FrlB-like protein
MLELLAGVERAVWHERAERLDTALTGATGFANEQASHLAGARVVWIAGEGVYGAIASEAALKLQEAAGIAAVALPLLDGLHGPVAAIHSDDVLLLLGEAGESVISAYTKRCDVVHVGGNPLVCLATVQLAAVAVAQHRGLDADSPEALQKVTNP